MWAIKILNGPQSGKIFPLQSGNNVIGRSTKADIRFADNGVSKNHAQLFVTNDKVIISDLKSSNGTFVNGIKVQNHGLKTGDKILVNQTIFTLFQLPDNVVFADPKLNIGKSIVPKNKPQAPIPATPSAMVQESMGHYQGSSALQPMMQQAQDLSPYAQPHLSMATSQNTAPAPAFVATETIAQKADKYIEEVALPPIYKTAEKMEFKYVLLIFALGFVFMSTFLSSIPLSRLTTESVITESKRRTLSLARNLANMNRKAMSEESELSLSTEFIERESGVEKAMIISSKSGAILAPTSMMGRYVKDPFIIALRNTHEERVEILGETSQIGASVPMKFFNPDVGDSTISAYAVVVYNIDPLAIDFNRTLSLFIQIFLIACAIGGVVFFVQYRLMVYPMRRLNKELGKALSDGQASIHIPFQLPIFQELINSVNSALSRVSSQFTDTNTMASVADKSAEALEVVNMFPQPAFALDPITKRFVAVNEALEHNKLFASMPVLNQSIDDLTDRSLYECLKDLVSLCESNPNGRHRNLLPSQGSETYEITAKAIVDGHKTSYILLTVMEVLEEGGE